MALRTLVKARIRFCHAHVQLALRRRSALHTLIKARVRFVMRTCNLLCADALAWGESPMVSQQSQGLPGGPGASEDTLEPEALWKALGLPGP